MKTFSDLYVFLQNHDETNIKNWLSEPWKGKDKQESLLRIFAGLGLIDKLGPYTICKGNFNKGTITPYEKIQDIFYHDDFKEISLNDSGDKSDLHGKIVTSSKKILLATTSKNLNSENIGKLDLRDIDSIHKNIYSDYELHMCLCIRDKNKTLQMIERSEESSHDLKNLLTKDSTIILDWDDLNSGYLNFKKIYNNLKLQDIFDSQKSPIVMKMHQQYSVSKTIKLKESGEKEILWGHIQRSGKSYIIGGCIIEDSLQKEKCNYLVVTTAPKETIQQYLTVFDCLQLKDFNVIGLDGKNKNPKLSSKNIIVCSKQFLQGKIGEKNKSIPWLKKIVFDIRFLDESHNGGTTELADRTLKYYGNDSFTIQITATYSKPVNSYKIEKKNWVLWDLEDIQLCKSINSEGKRERLIEKHPELERFLNENTDQQIINEYSKYPELYVLTRELNEEIVDEILENTKDNPYGWSTESCFLLEEEIVTEGGKKSKKILEKFQNEKENLKIWYEIFGKFKFLNIPDDEYPDEKIFKQKIKEISQTSKASCDIFNDIGEPTVVMAFLPTNNIKEISNATKKLLEDNKVIPDFEIVCINSKSGKDPKTVIDEELVKLKKNKKNHLLVLSGRQCSLGVTIKNCDVVLLLNNNTSFDLIYQMMFRCMSERKNKKAGFVIDLNIQRTIQNVIVEYASILNPKLHLKVAINYLLKERIINLNANQWMYSLGKSQKTFENFCKLVYDIYSSNSESVLKHLLNRLKNKEIELNKEDQKFINDFYTGRSGKSLIVKENKKEIKKGKEKKKLDEECMIIIESSSDEDEDEESTKKINFTEIINFLTPLICILTIKNKETFLDKMYLSIEKDENLHHILVEQTKIWWGKVVEEKTIKNIITLYTKYMEEDKESENIIRTIKEIFIKNKDNIKGLSKSIDKYLIPQEIEKKSNAEVSTPYELRQEMLDKIPKDFWKTPKKVFEPCAGKGGFVIDIIERFMIGLKDSIPDKEERYKTIVEECLYFSDINPTNIFICKLLVDIDDKYKLNYNEGNTLELDIKGKWNLNGFDGIIGNPPYNSSGDTGTGNTIWQDFTKVSLNKLLKNKGYLLYVHPPGWRKPNTERGKFYGLYKLMTQENQMIYLSIHGIKDGLKTFNCGTRYDWYIIQRTSKYTTTIVNDEKNNEIIIDTNKFDWLPNYNIDTIQNILAKENEEKCNIIYDRTSYGADKKDRVSKIKTDEFKYPCVHSTPKSGIRYMYSKVNDRGHFGVSKVIFGDSGINQPIIDINGSYGMTQHAMGIEVVNESEATQLSKALTSEKMKILIDSCLFSSYAIDWNIFKDLKKDFWKQFI
tara:strand:- start:351 stop:4328 length:3978 start_codon:yes stop_codon:yes gene_type:complete